jgi:anti-sigma regulatory factor (Ser/Thr protein kinase)
VEALLTEQWLAGLDSIDVIDEASLTLARDAVRALDVPSEVLDRALLVVSELGRNQLRHARLGRIACRRVERGERVGLEIIAADAGDGIDDIDLILESRGRTTGSLGVGVGAVRRLSTELDIDVRVGEGSCLFARVFESDVLRTREVGIYGRPLAGERQSGDHAAFRREGAALHAMVCDGLGHGPDARAAADAAIDVFFKRAGAPPATIIEETHPSLVSTRGVVMAVARIDEAGLELASAGNVEALVTSFRSQRRFGGTAATVGGRPGPLRARTERASLSSDEVLVLMTDGIVTKASIEEEPALLRSHPAVIAQRILERFARTTDDALVLVVR